MNTNYFQHFKSKAFTLAETLIVIGIIGVVAALTLPNLNHATGDKEKVTRIKKIYSTLTEAIDRAEAIYGPVDEWFNGVDLSDVNTFVERGAQRITEFMKISKVCGTTEGCFAYDMAETIQNEEGEDLGNYDEYAVITADGTAITFVYYPSAEEINLHMWVDIDGPKKGKNLTGYDIFEFFIDFTQKPPTLVPDCHDFNFTNLLYYSVQKACGATWMLNYDNADYMKITNNDGTCENGGKATEANPRCE